MVTIERPPDLLVGLLIGLLLVLCVPKTAHAQLGSLVSPGPLSKAHANLEGLSNCQQCHERGRQVSASLCLTCHKPVAERMVKKVGVHKNVKDDCVSCHVDHAGVDGEVRPFDQAGFKHDTETAFRLDGKHAPLKGQCAACHKGRSFLEARTTCVSCHTDVHKGDLGTTCERCHATNVAFKAATQSFDHRLARFALTGAHQTTTCASCHKGPSYKVASFGSCTSCHTSPHPPKSVAGSCTSCHTTATWATTRFDHATTKFPLVGKHITATCASCHKAASTRVKPAASTCATCHVDPHKGEFKQDCKSCHDEKGFSGGTFDHATTRLPLVDGHAKVACQNCHKGITHAVPTARASVDFRGTRTECVTCHADPHRPALAGTCESCHSAKSFRVTTFAHKGPQDFFGGQHASLTCEKCHQSAPMTGPAPRLILAAARFTATPTACAACHRDVHLGQVGGDCERCHTVNAVKFAADRFNHDSATFRLTGAHVPLACAKCHSSATAAFAGGSGTAVRLTGVSSQCDSCHKDVHLGQVVRTCDSCHDTRTFDVKEYTHKNPPRGFFVGPHIKAECVACHKTTTAAFPSGRGTAIAFKVSAACVGCHEDVHRGSLGPNCRDCHKLTPLAGVHQPGLPAWVVSVPVFHPGLL